MKTGLEVFLEKEHRRFRKASLGVLCHPASITPNYRHISELLLDKKYGLKVGCFFGPQHGIRGEKQDNMVESSHFTDHRYNVPVYSLYSETRIPTAKMFSHLDVLLIDLQDIGCRIYTFMYTMANCMKVARNLGKKVVVLDRPNPIGCELVEGITLDTNFVSFVGQFPIPTRHGLTMGELAHLFNEVFEIHCDLEVIACKGVKRKDDGFSWGYWVPPSPNIPTVDSAMVFPATVIFEGTQLSEARGTTKPFEWVGAPYIDADVLAKEMNGLKLPGIYFRPIYFQPTYQKGKDEVLGGVHLHIIDRKKFRPVAAGQRLLATIAKLYPDKFAWKQPPYEYEYEKMPIDLIAGSDQLRKIIDQKGDLKPLEQKMKKDSTDFQKLAKKFQLY